jgi:hypothetical protein
MMKRAILVAGLLLAACGPASQSQPPASLTESVPASASASVSATVGEGGGQLCAEGHTPCQIPAGSYTAAPFVPNFSFAIAEPWQNDRAFADGGGISLGSAGGIFWASQVSRGTVGGEEVAIGGSVDDFVSFLQRFEALGVTVSDPTPVTVDGVSGQQVDVATNEAEAPGLYLVAEDAFNLVPGEKARFMVLEKDGETVLLIIDSFTTDGFDEWIATAQPVLDTIAWQ